MACFERCTAPPWDWGWRAWGRFGTLGGGHCPISDPQRSQSAAANLQAGKPADYAEGCVETKYRESHGVWIVRQPQTGGRASSPSAPPAPIWAASRCGRKASRGFAVRVTAARSPGGEQRRGPAPRPLERCAIRIAEDGQIEIDTGRTFQEERGEWDEPESFVEA